MKTEFTCPAGHTVQATELHSYVSLTEANLDDGITFECPGGKRGHSFTLRKAVAKGMFTEEEAANIRAGGERYRAENEATITASGRAGL